MVLVSAELSSNLMRASLPFAGGRVASFGPLFADVAKRELSYRFDTNWVKLMRLGEFFDGTRGFRRPVGTRSIWPNPP